WGEWRFIRLKKDQGNDDFSQNRAPGSEARAVKVSVDYGEFGQFAEWLGILALKY
ncbi:19970_t:CDS:2, partial [Entrophospora sp. SA101]